MTNNETHMIPGTNISFYPTLGVLGGLDQASNDEKIIAFKYIKENYNINIEHTYLFNELTDEEKMIFKIME